MDTVRNTMCNKECPVKNKKKWTLQEWCVHRRWPDETTKLYRRRMLQLIVKNPRCSLKMETARDTGCLIIKRENRQPRRVVARA